MGLRRVTCWGTTTIRHNCTWGPRFVYPSCRPLWDLWLIKWYMVSFSQNFGYLLPAIVLPVPSTEPHQGPARTTDQPEATVPTSSVWQNSYHKQTNKSESSSGLEQHKPTKRANLPVGLPCVWPFALQSSRNPLGGFKLWCCERACNRSRLVQWLRLGHTRQPNVPALPCNAAAI
jgi:hypothetical protein